MEGEIEIDERLPEVRTIERTIEQFIQENFPRVTLKMRVPAPELGAILKTAELLINDGIETPIANKGDGLKRALVFAIIRSIGHIGEATTNDNPRTNGRFILLFEEPELYLHPTSQLQLFQALKTLSIQQTVVVTTHSPLFFEPNLNTTFIKLSKNNRDLVDIPSSVATVIDVSDISSRDQLQLIAHENNNAALFFERIVLIEGDSDYVLLPHFAKLINPSWDCNSHGISFVRISGKGSIRRYREFFAKFAVKVFVVCDLDVIVKGFEQVTSTQSIRDLRGKLMSKLGDLSQREDAKSSVKTKSLKTMQDSGEVKQLWKNALSAYDVWKKDVEQWDHLSKSVEAFIERLKSPQYYDLLRTSEDADLIALKRSLIEALQAEGIHILFRGCIEDYFPGTSVGRDKVDKAISFQSHCKSVEILDRLDATAGCESPSAEFSRIFASIF